MRARAKAPAKATTQTQKNTTTKKTTQVFPSRSYISMAAESFLRTPTYQSHSSLVRVSNQKASTSTSTAKVAFAQTTSSAPAAKIATSQQSCSKTKSAKKCMVKTISPKTRKQKCFVAKAKLCPDAQCPKCGERMEKEAVVKMNFTNHQFDALVRCPNCKHEYAAYMSVSYDDGKAISPKVKMYCRVQIINYFKKNYPDKTRKQLQQCFEEDATLCYNCILHFHEKGKPENFLANCKEALFDSSKKRKQEQAPTTPIKKQKKNSLLSDDLTPFSSKDIKIAICELKLELAKRM